MAWPQAMDNCNYNNKTLVVMETEREWEFVKNEIQNRVGSNYGEWFIGLEQNFTTGNWTWVNGKPLTINKWQRSNPEPSDFYGLIHKEYPAGYKGSFSTISGNIQTSWICEEETDNCQGDCFFHIAPPSTSPPGTKAVTTRGKTSTEQDITDVSGKFKDM
ncbi:CD209 antigen-like [Stylophora pistillata]|uniref:CD209 antigen-like n=1 Tax=Stylophora pistillata TaxID=50429 RepID=UPI000C03F588|nr:CD209 antigen-like [Stylophora pistillata]